MSAQTSSLHELARDGDLEGIRYLVEKEGASANKKSESGQTPLHVAACWGYLDVVKYLVGKGAAVNEKSEDGETPLYVAACWGYLDVVKHLINNGAAVNEKSEDGETPLHEAARLGRLDMVKYLVDKGATLNEKGYNDWTPLHIAARRNRLEVVKYLIGEGAILNEKNMDGNTPLHLATYWGHLNVVRYLVDNGVAVNEESEDVWTPLHLAAYQGHINVVKYLVDNGAALNEKGEDGRTSLHLAATLGHLNVVKYLIDSGAAMNEKAKNGETPLHVAAKQDHLDVVKYLIEKAVVVNEKTKNDETPLHLMDTSNTLLLDQQGSQMQIRAINSINTTTQSHLELHGPKSNQQQRPQPTPLSYMLDDVSVQYVLEQVYRLCMGMYESEVMCTRIYTRLIAIYSQANSLTSVTRKAVLNELSRLLPRYHKLLTMHSSQDKLILRFAGRRKLTDQIKQFHQDIDAIVGWIGSPQGVVAQSFSEELWQKDQQVQEGIFALFCQDKQEITKTFKDTRSRKEALTLLCYETTKQRQKSSKTYLELMNTLAKDIVNLDHVQDLNIQVDPWFIPPYDVVWEEKPFSRGSFGSVHHGEWCNLHVVVKRLLSECDDMNEHQFLKEVKVWHSLKHEHVVRLYGACHAGELFFVCEYAPHGTLPEFLRKPDNEHLKWQKIYEVALGLQYLYEENVIHGDLKGNNLLVGADGKGKIADFGLSHIVVTSTSIKPAAGTGAVQWKAPEILMNRGKSPISFKSDIYSFAMCIIEIITDDFPWRKDIPDAAVICHVKEGILPDKSEHFSKEQWQLITEMCAFEPSKRPKISTVVRKIERFCKELSSSEFGDVISDTPVDSCLISSASDLVSQNSTVTLQEDSRSK